MVRAEKGAWRRYQVGHSLLQELRREGGARMPAELVARWSAAKEGQASARGLETLPEHKLNDHPGTVR